LLVILKVGKVFFQLTSLLGILEKGLIYRPDFSI